ncbi:PepSY domain-containing protein [Sulfurimonas autotrophica]|uniref:PepSY-associated TM helix domain protein n=1 Tax=Sulfurimonas autotrophica (strain ATCC BAA-671 / DSM 16294 / JCM 11897 / OK10) TaxID=563040 RepID=E0UTM8_SULAO|nr:PepSY domain-containing protein [Sulfurimonas autotrophica]ADN08259.1 PepSY-associated TM helix domain protein [Sulfurimonas autotrophica DSM 16294]
MVKIYKLHKISGISAGIILLILSVSGFFLDHDKWSFLYTTTFSSVPSQIKSSEKRLFNAYYKDKENAQHILVGGYRGLFESFNGGKKFSNISNLQILSIIPDKSILYLATSDGIYSYNFKHLKRVALQGEYITALSVSKKQLVAVLDKEKLVTIDKNNLQISNETIVKITKEALKEDIKLSRLVRDLHYGRGLFDGGISLLINDYGALVLAFLSLSGYMIWFLIKRKKYPQISRKLIKTHANIFAIIAIIPLFILSVTGIFLDHSSGLAKFMNSVKIPHSTLPPIYNSLRSDIWSVDFDGKTYRIGNRYGIYKSTNLKNWRLENRGLAYKMIRRDGILYVSGMGAPNRIYKDNKFYLLPDTPHMFRDILVKDKEVRYFSSMQKGFYLPQFHDITLYTLLLTLHDGTFFSSWWGWINDFAAIALILLGITGTMRWSIKKRKNLNKVHK